MSDPFGAIATQAIGDLGVHIGNGQWAGTGHMPTEIPANITGPGGALNTTTVPGWTFVHATRLDIIDGSPTHPVTVAKPTFQVSRYEAQAGTGVQNAAIQGVVIASNTTPGGTAQAIRGYAEQRNAGDIVGIDATSVIAASPTGTGQTAYGFYTAAADFSGTGYVVGFNAALQVKRDQAYTTTAPFSNGSFMQALLVSGGTTGQAYRVPFAYGAYANTPADVTFDVGFAAILGVKSAAFRDDTAALRGLDLHGTGYDAAVDLTNATINSGGSQVKFQGGVSYTPTVTSTVNAYTSVTTTGHYILLGKLLYFSAVINQVNAGIAAGTIQFSLPLSLTSRDGTALPGWNASTATSFPCGHQYILWCSAGINCSCDRTVPRDQWIRRGGLMQEPQFSYTIDELRALIGQKEVDLFVLRRELAKAEEVNAALYLELHPERVAEGGSGGETP